MIRPIRHYRKRKIITQLKELLTQLEDTYSQEILDEFLEVSKTLSSCITVTIRQSSREASTDEPR